MKLQAYFRKLSGKGMDPIWAISERFFKGSKWLLFCGPLLLLSSCTLPKFEGRTNVWEGTAGQKNYGTVLVDSSFSYNQVSIEKKGIPAMVAAEAANPSIVNPYSGTAFTAAQIGAYSPRDTLQFGEWNLGLKYVFPKVPFFVGADLDLMLNDPRTENGTLGDNYTYARLLNTSGVDFVRYFYGIKYDQWIVKPSFGFHWEIGEPEKRWFFQPTVKYEDITLTYVKGIEAFEDKHIRRTLSQSDFNTFDVSVKIGVLIKSPEKVEGWIAPRRTAGAYIFGGPLITDKTGVNGWSIGVGGLIGF